MLNLVVCYLQSIITTIDIDHKIQLHDRHEKPDSQQKNLVNHLKSTGSKRVNKLKVSLRLISGITVKKC